MPRLPPIVTFAAPSGTGKTTLLERVVAVLTKRGHRIAVVKHDAHRLQLDTPGKDSWRMRQAGAWRVIVAGSDQLGLFSAVDGEVSLGGLVAGYLAEADLVLTEGFRRAGLPTLRVHREAKVTDPTWETPAQLIAWVSDGSPDTDLPVLGLDDPEGVASFLQARFLAPLEPRSVSPVFPLARQEDVARIASLVTRAQALFDGRGLAVVAPGVVAPSGLPSVHDVRPGLGPLGALLTGLVAVDTPDVLLLGPRHQDASDAMMLGVALAAPRADLVVPVHDGFHEPLLARYGHRCLTAIQGSLLSGEPRMDRWWGQVRVEALPESTWSAWDPDDTAFGR